MKHVVNYHKESGKVWVNLKTGVKQYVDAR